MMRFLSGMALLVAVAGVASGVARGQEVADIAGKVLSVSDGNTFTVESGGKKYTVRLLGVEAPL